MAAISIAFFFLLLSATAQPPPTTGGAPAPESDTCNGIWINYEWVSGKKLHPIRSSPKQQSYSFKSQLNILNNDDVELKSWKVFLGFHNSEILVSSDGAVLANGTSLPSLVGEGTILAGFPNADLKTGIQTAGDLSQMSATVLMRGTQFGVSPPNVPLPSNVSLVNQGYSCSFPANIGNSSMSTCCVQDANAKSNMTIGDYFLPRQNGDLTIMYDVTNAYADKYFAEVTITNHNPLGRLDYWQLSWDWTLDEFIYSMKGAYPNVVNTNDCLTGPQGKFYTSLDFSTVLNCQRRPTIIDLPPQYANDTLLGLVPFCCRNGTILPPGMDESKSTSAFQVQVFKMPPNINLSSITPPQNWQIEGILNPDYRCGPPVRVSASQFPSPTGLHVNTTAVASWQVVCNITQPKNVFPKCCVSFSTYFNESTIPCKTCACGCSRDTAQTCSTTALAMFIPPEAQLVPFENRTKLALAWAGIQHQDVPDPLPCPDNCGVSINWHVLTDYNKGWSARVTLFNWEDLNFADWFLAAELDKAALGFQKAYSFNGTIMTDENNTIFMQGLPGLNYLVGEANGTKVTDPRVPGKQQSVLSFTKKTTPGIRVGEGDGFPRKVYFNGEECSLPSIIPSNTGINRGHFPICHTLLSVMILIFIHQ